MSRVMMWANYRRGPSISVPSPHDGDPSVPWWYDKIALLAHGWAQAGFTDILFPNPLKTNAGAYPGADGYGVFDDMDISSKTTTQFGGQATRFGIDEQLRRAIAICHANGLNVLLDHVMHQRQGGHGNATYTYLGADGKTQNGRFPKTSSCFLGDPPRVPRDPIAGPVGDDFAFGDELCPINAIPHDYVAQGLIAAGDWLFRTLDADGARLDCMKGMNASFIKRFISSGAMAGKWFFGEYADGNPDTLNWWVDQIGGLCSATDFGFHYNMAMAMCAANDSFQMRWLSSQGRGMIHSNPMKAVPFVESMDSDTNGFATIVNNKILAYALMLAGEGLPTVYVRDYLREPDCYGLQGNINNLVWINRNLADGNTITRYGDDKVYIFERDGGHRMIMALNNSVWDPNWKFITVQTGFGNNVQLHDYTGHNANDTWTDYQGRATLAIPPGANGLGYCCWSRAGLNLKTPTTSRSTTQIFYGAADLDIAPALNGQRRVARIWVAKDSTIAVTLTPEQTGWLPSTSVQWQIGDPDGIVTDGAAVGFDLAIHPGVTTSATRQHQATSDGWHTLYLVGSGLSLAGSPFELKVTYTAPRTFTLPTQPAHLQRVSIMATPEQIAAEQGLAEAIAAMAAQAADLRQQRLAQAGNHQA